MSVEAERFLREIRVVARLSHPHILPLFDSGQADELLYFVMPYVQGESLRRRLQREGRLPVPVALRIACEVALALDYAHRHGVIHRDIKPENILFEDDQAIVADFGVAAAVEVGRRGADHRVRPGGRNAGLHEPGTGGRRGPARRPERHLQSRLRALRDARRRAAVHRRHPAGRHDPAGRGPAASAPRPAPRGAGPRLASPRTSPGQGARRTLRHAGGVRRRAREGRDRRPPGRRRLPPAPAAAPGRDRGAPVRCSRRRWRWPSAWRTAAGSRPSRAPSPCCRSRTLARRRTATSPTASPRRSPAASRCCPTSA